MLIKEVLIVFLIGQSRGDFIAKTVGFIENLNVPLKISAYVCWTRSKFGGENLTMFKQFFFQWILTVF